MRALLALGLLLLCLAVGAVMIASAQKPEAAFVAAERIDIGEVGGKGPGFDVETGSVAPGTTDTSSAAREDEISVDPSDDREDVASSAPVNEPDTAVEGRAQAAP